ncbi:hypothetical protein ASPCAL01049 [Aspergillus calidoustus]|uniref:Zn(2)-C6 fungal-type domain-containing protein n=1 Tax=Aspergillus calidoustus TaxID=454130 RepID=A0A0U5FQ10_ASPCI|nr:hypothetical protein ASPCAL01049 [Aspergillus calidoustus]
MAPVDAGETIEARRHRLSSVPRACEGCKIRKVRCDRTIPCANCRAAKITCRQPNDKSSRQVQADRVANLQGIVEHLEKRLQTVESRLATLEQPQSQPQPQPQPVASTAYAVSSTPRPVEGLPVAEGEPSFAAQSLQASESARTACQSDSGTEHLLRQLQSNIRASDGLSRSNFVFRKSTSNVISTPQLLPATLVTCILQRMHAHRPIFLSSYAVSDLSLVESLYQKVYSTTELVSPGEIANMHGVLSLRTDLVAAVETYEVLAVPSFENILALVMGMIKAQGESKPYLYWQLVSAAVTHCQSLNYHRESTYLQMAPQE